MSATRGVEVEKEVSNSNPDHVVEIHPAVSMTCGDQKLNFLTGIRALDAFRFASYGTVESCLNEYRLSARWSSERNEEEFLAQRRCSNWARIHVYKIVEVRENAIGHRLRVVAGAANGGQQRPHTLYSIKGSPFDDSVVAG